MLNEIAKHNNVNIRVKDPELGRTGFDIQLHKADKNIAVIRMKRCLEKLKISNKWLIIAKIGERWPP